MACALPAHFQAGGKTYLLCKSPVSGDVEIALYSADGKTRRAVLHTGRIEGGIDGMKGVYIYQWDGKEPGGKQVEGPARIRWTYNDADGKFPGQYREQPIHIAP